MDVEVEESVGREEVPVKPTTRQRAKVDVKGKGSAVAKGEESGYESDNDDIEGRGTKNGKKVYDSDALDEDSASVSEKGKRARTSRSPRKKSKKRDESEGEDSELELEEGQEVVGRVVKAPKEGWASPGMVSKNTLEFLGKLKQKECNDRKWFKLHGTPFSGLLLFPPDGDRMLRLPEPIYRRAEQEWKDFVEAFTDVLAEVDNQIPHLPPKDVIHRIYRDVRFSNDKTPYKKGFSASFSRSGRKGAFAGYHLAVKPGNESLIAAGVWCPGKNELATIRSNLQRNSRRLRDIISSPTFVKYFGKAEPHPSGERQNIFGQEDELKKAPKGVDKDHKDIDLLRCRSYAVAYRFTDEEVMSEGFKEKVGEVVEVMRPFVHCLNDLMTVGFEMSESESA
ncbi:hypothetical protein AMATHDRAFT_153318 [Amanita thiersii Skay4041]|uniref:DUF2461 domain-containing protein n=1 Tax=Amanita thiersii Skay4041 TaxID=703135 RepID=A0A2A9N8Y2_9AGAR|nr:hypothetical protein AMATHDRAFT_153318 [Amanita thiersii Skay4041]